MTGRCWPAGWPAGLAGHAPAQQHQLPPHPVSQHLHPRHPLCCPAAPHTCSHPLPLPLPPAGAGLLLEHVNDRHQCHDAGRGHGWIPQVQAHVRGLPPSLSGGWHLATALWHSRHSSTCGGTLHVAACLGVTMSPVAQQAHRHTGAAAGALPSDSLWPVPGCAPAGVCAPV